MVKKDMDNLMKYIGYVNVWILLIVLILYTTRFITNTLDDHRKIKELQERISNLEVNYNFDHPSSGLVSINPENTIQLNYNSKGNIKACRGS